MNILLRASNVPWGNFMGASLMLLLFLSVVKFSSSNQAVRDAVTQLFIAAVASMFGVRYIAGLTDAKSRYLLARKAHRGRVNALISTQPPEIASNLLYGLRLVHSLFARPSEMRWPIKKDAISYGYVEKTDYKLINGAIAASLLVEIPLIAFLIPLLEKDAQLAQVLERAALGLAAAAVVLIWAATSRMTSRKHSVSSHVLSIRLGARIRQGIRISAIKSVNEVNSSATGRSEASIAPLGRTNIRLEFCSPIYIFDLCRWVDVVYLHVDEPAEFISDLKTRINQVSSVLKGSPKPMAA